MTKNDPTLSKMTVAKLAGIYSIPSYQRGYRWTKGEVTALLNDLADYLASGVSDGYCLQPLVLQPVKGRKGVYNVVDGQQRLTTLYIIAYALTPNTKPSWNLEYTTEGNKKLSDLLDETGQESSINSEFRRKAFNAVSSWRDDNPETANKVQHLLATGNVFFLRYLIDPEDDGHEVFQRLNANKTPLTSSELIRALFLESDNGLCPYQRIDIAKEWDLIASDYGDEAFWGIWNTRLFNKIPTRIDFLFSIVCGCPPNEARLSPLAIYLKFEEWTKTLAGKNKKEQLQTAWEKVLRCYWWMQSCFADPETRLFLGWVFEFTDNQAYVLYRDVWSTKANNRLSAFRDEIRGIVQGALKDVDDIGLLRYGDALVKEVFVLINGLVAIKRKENFRFDLYRKDNWDIEHIDSQTENPLDDAKDREEWLKHVKAEMSPDEWEKLDQKTTFEDLWNHVWMQFKPKDASDKVKDPNAIGNLALLDSGTNRAYKNAIFPAKRRRILQTVRESSKPGETAKYIPPLTEEAFSKVYSSCAAQMRYWGQSDADNYKAAMSRLFTSFMKNGD